MSDNRQLLEYIYKNAQMKLRTLPKMIEKSTNPQLTDSLQRQIFTFEDISREAETLIKEDEENSDALSGLNPVQKIISNVMNVSAGNVADMIIKDNANGVKDVSLKMRRSPEANIGTLRLAEKLRQAEQANIDEMQNFTDIP